MLPRRMQRSAGPRRPAGWPPPGPALVLLALLVGASAGQPRLLGCRTAAAEQLLSRAALSAPADGVTDCAALCAEQSALLAAVGQRWCFCLNQPASGTELTADCSGSAPAGLELLRVYSLTEPAAARHSQAPLTSLQVGSVHLEFVRCALSTGSSNDPARRVDICVHWCSVEVSGGFMALGPSEGSSEQYECHCSAEDEFGSSLDAATCDEHCTRYGEVLPGTTCGGQTGGGATALSVYRLVDDSAGSTPTPVTTRRSTGHSVSFSGITDSACPDGGVQVDQGSCYRPETVTGDRDKPGTRMPDYSPGWVPNIKPQIQLVFIHLPHDVNWYVPLGPENE